MSMCFDHCFHKNYFWPSWRSFNLKKGCFLSWCVDASMNWCSFAVFVSFYSYFALCEANKFLSSYRPPFFLHIFLHAFRTPLHIPLSHFQDLASTWEYIRLALHQLFPPVPLLCGFIVCLLPATPCEMLCCPVSLFMPLSFKSKALMLCWCFSSVFVLVLNKWGGSGTSQGGSDECHVLKVISYSYAMATNPTFESCILMSHVKKYHRIMTEKNKHCTLTQSSFWLE